MVAPILVVVGFSLVAIIIKRDKSRLKKRASLASIPKEKVCDKCGGEAQLCTHLLGRNVGPEVSKPYYSCTCGNEMAL